MAFANLFSGLPCVNEAVEASCHVDSTDRYKNGAFANLFSGLPCVNEAVKEPSQVDSTDRYGTKGGGRKRKTQEHGFHVKKRYYQTNTYSDAFKDSHIQTACYQSRGTESHTKQLRHDQNGKHQNHGDRHCKGQQKKSNNNSSGKQQQRKMRKGNKGKMRNDYWDGRKRTSRKLERSRNGFAKEKTVYMSQEFKEQNALEVDGRLLCRHFLWGRCIKADTCQLEHVQSYNDLIKVGCKFYCQGLCTKGESCPYMHKSFPCKFFHRKGKCFQQENCRFSHEPLTDVTEKLLDEAIKRDNEFYENEKKSELASSGEPENTNESEVPPANENPDTLLALLRPSFYNSADVEEQTSVCQEAEPDAGSEADPPRSPTPDQKEPVCYSVEAVLGPQLSRPLFSFFTKPVSQEPASPSVPPASSEAPYSSVNPNEAPYSVDTVLRSFHSESSPKHPPELRPHGSVLTTDFLPLMKPNVGVRGSKSRPAAVLPATSSVQTTVSKTQQHLQNIQSNLKLDPSSEPCDGFSLQSPFYGLSVGMTDGAMPKPSCGFTKPKQSSETKGNGTPNTSFLSLFSSPLGGTTSLPSESPCRLLPAGDTLSINQQKASDVASLLSHWVFTDAKQIPQKTVSPECSSSSKNDSSGDPSVCLTEQGVPNASPPRVKSEDSVLKTLFVSLGPYQEDPKQQYNGLNMDVKEVKIEKTECGSSKPQVKREKPIKEEQKDSSFL